MLSNKADMTLTDESQNATLTHRLLDRPQDTYHACRILTTLHHSLLALYCFVHWRYLDALGPWLALVQRAVAASTTEKGFSTSVSDGVIFAKLTDRFIQVNASLLTSADVTVNDGAVLFTGKVKTPKIKLRPPNWLGNQRCAR